MLINLSSGSLSKSQVQDYAKRINKIDLFDGRTALAGSGSDRTNIELSVSFDFEVADNMDDISDSDHVLAIVDAIPDQGKGESNPVGIATRGGHTAAVEAKHIGKGKNASAHELGHNLGLGHVKGLSSLMYHTAGNRTNVSFGEKRVISGGLLTGKEGKTRIGSVNEYNPNKLNAKEDLKDFLERVNANYNDN